MPNSDLTTTVTAIELLDRQTLDVLVTTNDIRENYVSELRRLTGTRFETTEVLFRRPEWLTGFSSPSRDLSYVSRWDDRIYVVATGNETVIQRPSEAITRIVRGPEDQVFATCYWGLLQWLHEGRWDSLDLGREVDLFDVLPLGRDEFYVCGTEGTLGRWANGNITFVDLPTDAPFFALAQDSRGEIIVAGEGVLFKGSGATWEEISVDETTFHHARQHEGAVDLGGGERGLYRLTGDSLVPVNGDLFAYYLADCDDLIATCGANKVWIIDHDKTYAITFDHLF